MENKELVIKEDVIEKVKKIEITDTITFKEATVMLKGINELMKKIDATFKPIIAKAHEAHMEAIAGKAKHYEKPKEAKEILSEKISKYHQEQEVKRIAEQIWIEEKERKKLEEMKLNEAEKLEATGNIKAAEIVLNTVTPNLRINIRSETKTTGISYRDNWKFKIIDLELIPEKYKSVDLGKIGREVKEKKSGTKIPGVEVFLEKTTIVR